MFKSIIVSFFAVLLVCLSGCASTSTLQAKLDKSVLREADLRSRLELAEGKVQEVSAELTKQSSDRDICERTLSAARKGEQRAAEVIKGLYQDAKPVVVDKVNAAINATKDWASDAVK